MKVRDLMCENVRTCAPEHSLASAAQEMWDGDCGTLPVVDEARRVVGMITDRDICMAAYLNDRSPRAIAVRDVMSSRVHHCGAEDGIERPLEIMKRQRVRRLPVVDGSGELRGLLSINDLILAASDSVRKSADGISCTALVDAVKGICEHTVEEAPVS